MTATAFTATLTDLTAGSPAAVVSVETGVFYPVRIARVTTTQIKVAWGKGEISFDRTTGRHSAQYKRYRLTTQDDPRFATWLVGNEVARVMTKVAHQAGGVRITRDQADALRQLDLLSTILDQAREALGGRTSGAIPQAYRAPDAG